MTITITLKDEAARIVQKQLDDGQYPDAASAVTAALMLLEDTAMNWADVDAQAMQRLIAESDAEGGEIPIGEAMNQLDAAIASARRR